MLKLDHLALTGKTLEEAVAHCEDVLGITLAAGGRHEAFGTHNRLLGLGDVYLEAIAIDPDGAAPSQPRWFDMDNFSGPPRLRNWICATDDLAAALECAPPGTGRIWDLRRDDLTWQMAVPEDGKLPFDGAFPALIAWGSTTPPPARLPDVGCRLVQLEVAHPEADALRTILEGRLDDRRVTIVNGFEKALRAIIATPHGNRVLE